MILPLCREIWRRRVNASLQALRSWFVRIGHHLRQGGAAYGVLLISLLLTLLASYYVRQNVEAQNRLRFDETTQATQEAIERRTEAYLDAMLGARGLFYASKSVTRGEWGNYVEGLEPGSHRSEEHTSELQSRQYLVCRLLLEKKK